MNMKTMEGLVGARTNIDLVNVPMRVYKEARRRGDVGTMERAMGYAVELEDKADEYSARAEEGMKEDAEDAREKAELQRQQMIEELRAEQNEQEERTEKLRAQNRGQSDRVESLAGGDPEKDVLEVSEEGRRLLEQSLTQTGAGREIAGEGAVTENSGIYTLAGEVSRVSGEVNISVKV